MNWTWYRAGRVVTRFIVFCTMRLRVLRPDIPERAGGYVLALSHQGHLDPFLASTLQDRPVVWMTRKEFYRYGWSRWLLARLNAFPVNRQGIAVSSIRRAITAAREGHAVGICPEGGVACGAEACFRGGPIRRGVCSVAIRGGVPIVPCVILGSARLKEVGPWLPFKWGRLWIAYGEPIAPPAGKSTRARRQALANELSEAYRRLYAELEETFDVDPAWVA